jgi:hypothetical protein
MTTASDGEVMSGESTYFEILGGVWRGRSKTYIGTDATLSAPFFRGRRIAAEFPRTVIVTEARSALPDFLSAGSVDAVTNPLRDLLVQHGVNAEFIEIEVKATHHRTVPRYHFMNVLDIIDCIDRQRSKIEEFSAEAGGGILGIDELYLDDSKLSGQPLFVLGGRPLLMAHESLKSAIEAAGFTGIKFQALPHGPF